MERGVHGKMERGGPGLVLGDAAAGPDAVGRLPPGLLRLLVAVAAILVAVGGGDRQRRGGQADG